MSFRQICRVALFAAVGALGLFISFRPTFLSGFSRMQPEAGDVALNHYFLEHTYLWAFDRNYPFSFWSPGFFTPTPDVFTYSETLIGAAPIYWLLRIGLEETLACQVWMVIVSGLNFAAMAVALRWFGGRFWASAGGAYVFAFGLLRMDHLTHLQLFPQFYSPFAIWYAWAVLREPSRRRWTILVAVVSLQVFSSLHLGWFLGLGLAIFACFAFGVERGSLGRVWRFVRQQPVAAILPVLVAGLFLGTYARNFYRGTPERRLFAEVAWYLPYPDGWIVAPPNSLWADSLTPRPMDDFGERCLFQGIVLYALIFLSLRFAVRCESRSRTLVICSASTALLMALSVTRFGYEVSPWALVHAYVPGANAFRAVGRAAFVAYLFGLIGGLRGLDEFAERLPWKQRTRDIALAAIVIAMVAEQIRAPLDSFDKREALYGHAEQLRASIRGADAAYVVYDGSMPDYRHHIIVMWAGMWERVPVMNGFSGTQPSGGYPAYGDHPTIEHLVRSLGDRWQGKLVVIEGGPPIHRRTYNVEIGGRFTLAAED